MTFYILLNEDNRICMLTTEKQNDEQFEFEFPSDFNPSEIINYKIIDGELVYDEFSYPEPEPVITTEERVELLEDYTLELQYQVCLMQLGLE